MARSSFVAVWLMACGPCPPFGAIAIDGGTERSQGIVAGTLLAFEAWTAREGVCVDTVRLDGDLGGASGLESLGGYRSMRRLIELKEAQPHLADTLVHELCHAVDHQDGITHEDGETFDYDPTRPDAAVRSETSRRREAMALTCEAGPEALAAARSVAEACAPARVRRALTVVLQRVYAGMPDHIPPVAVRRTPVGAWTPPDGWSLDGTVLAGETGEMVVGARVDGDDVWVAIAPWTGDVVALPERATPPAPPPPAPTYLWEDVRSASWPDGQRAWTFRWRLASGATLHPLLIHDEDAGWRLPEDPCGSDGLRVLDLDGHVWVVEVDGDTLRWSVLDRDG